ncbi:energy-coupling factor transporter transmembrane component T family protein [Microbacterium oxydans]|uniref:Energy-coupling factor transporter transmembrane protein BioN n=1 Tax=Microbacterium oxydans TaxID=82380 RepID=A0A0F0L609_9MICO|nr:energy-coupling factor transporter transmembrane protein EcfT [Microbacterium oxydans]KJL27725.1 Energy-coupling factor transporter transmembrane protein BioN [Microbacterium oxydans]
MIQLYRPGTGLLHRTPVGVKLALLAAVALLLSLLPQDAVSIGATLLGVVGLYLAAGFPIGVLGIELWRIRWLILVLGVALAVFVSPVTAWISTGRVIALLLLAGLLTSTTRMADLLDALHRMLRPLRRIGVDADAVAMTLSLTLTMIPVVAGFADRVRDAQRARGVRLGVRAVVPLLVLALRHADEVGDALVARGLG